MASFTLKLLTSNTNNSFSFLETTMSEYYSQEDAYNTNKKENEIKDKKYSFCYTFNEKLSLHKNAQKELTFSMIKNIWLGDSLQVNPFVSAIHNGSQILLIDKYGNESFFTVKNIDYVLGNQNITYNVTCQDSFTYQMIRQNDGYVIKNDADSEDFIGAKTIDWWVINKIQPECHITYQYIPLFQGLYLDTTGNVQIFTSEKELKNVDKIIKPIWLKNNYQQYYETFPFSVSGSNASAALIALGEEIGLMLNVRENNEKTIEGIRTNNFSRYFWFEPEKHEETASLQYSPNDSIQSFSFSHAGDSLTTVLNVESNTVNDEVISLIPEVPLFFETLFEQWNNENEEYKYYEGFFTNICQNKIFKIADNGYINNAWYNSEEIKKIGDYCYFKIEGLKENFILSNFYNKINFVYDDEESFVYINKIRYTPYTSIWEFVVPAENFNEEEPEYIVYNDTYNFIPEDLFNKKENFYVRIKIGSTTPITDENGVSLIGDKNIILNFYRDTTEEELEFARIADRCPWLENKLIDFLYFYKQNIITRNEYQTLLDIIKNELRVVNGKLLVYSKQYYQALHTKTKILAELTESLDSVGAAFNADVVDSYAKNGTVGDITYFRNSYNDLIFKYSKIATPTQIINYKDLLTESVNKYFKSQQRFLKNIYNFRKYFNSLVDWSNGKLYRYTIELGNLEGNYLSFSKENFIKLTSENVNNINENIELFEKDKITKVEIVNETNYQNYYKKNEEGEYKPSQGNYNPKEIYYDKQENEGNITYNEIPYNGIVGKYIKKKLPELPEQSKWKIHNLNLKTNVSKLLNDDGITDLINVLSSTAWLNSFTEEDNHNNKWDPIADEEENIKNELLIEFYKQHFPLTSITYTGPKYIKINDSYVRANENNEQDEKTSYVENYELNLVTPETENNFYRRVKKNYNWWSLALTATGIGGIVYASIVNPIIYALDSGYWEISGKNKWYFTGDKHKTVYGYYDTTEINYAVKADAYTTYDILDGEINPQYYNYYSLIGFTYSSLKNASALLKEEQKLQFENSFLRPLTLDDEVSLLYNYKILIQRKEKDGVKDEYLVFKQGQENFIKNLIQTNDNKFSSILYYPIANNCAPINFSTLDWKEKRHLTLRELLVAAGYDFHEFQYNNDYWLEAQIREKDSFTTITFMVFQEQNFEAQSISENFVYKGEDIYDDKNSIIINPVEQSDLTDGLFVYSTNSYTKLIQNDDLDTIVKYKKINETTYKRVFTLNEIKEKSDSLNFYYLGCILYSEDSVEENPTFKIQMYAHNSENKTVKEIPELISFTKNDTQIYWKDPNTQKVYTNDVEISREEIYSFSTMTNGEFWYNFNSDFTHPLLLQRAALIESNLTQYWQQAFTASKYCEYFLPEYWQPNIAGNVNYFASNIISLKKENTETINATNGATVDQTKHIILLDDFVPNVDFYRENNNISLSSYDIYYQNYITNTEDSVKKEVNSNNQTKASEVLQNNKAFQQALEVLNENIDNFYVNEVAKTNYYYTLNGGIKWKDILSKLKSNNEKYVLFDGLYVMQYKILKSYFMNFDIGSYENLKKQHDTCWHNLYKNFPGVILENVYKNDAATTSSDLYTLAVNAFKDLSEPERGYSISIIDIPNLKGYIGQELTIGDSILLNAEDFYDEYDDVKKTLSQYLFITDISYDLRKDSDISLTVNSIKYQDKLIQRLAKLIK